MLQEVVAVRKSAHGKFWVRFSCGHDALHTDERHKRRCVKPNLVWDCPFCLIFDFEVGDEIELRLEYSDIPVLAKFMGFTQDGRLRFIFPQGEDCLIPREVVSYRKLR